MTIYILTTLIIFSFLTNSWHNQMTFVGEKNTEFLVNIVGNIIYIFCSVHRLSILIIVQRDATQSSLFIILQVHSTCFGCQPHSSSRLHKTVITASGTVQLKIWPVPEGVVTVLCTPADGCVCHRKHVEWTCRIINRLLCVACRWTIINIAI